MEKRLCAKVNLSCAKFTGGAIRTFSLMAMAGVLSMSAQAFSMDIDEAMKNKPVDTPTLEYLKTNEVLIPQKGKWDANKKDWAEADPIKAPNGSSYTIQNIDALSGDENNIEFTYTTSDKDGNLTDSYYKVNYETPSSQDYKIPEGYTEMSKRVTDLVKEDVTNVVYKDINYTISGRALGGAIYNITKDKSDIAIVANFINNTSKSETENVWGGAIYNIYGNLGDITGDFINNSAIASYKGEGGAIHNREKATIGNITGNFINNSASGREAWGGAIFNFQATIGNITGDFINNTSSSTDLDAKGALYNASATIGNITGDFINNSAVSTSAAAWGGAIFNNALVSYAIIGNINGDFINNSATAISNNAYGGAICNNKSAVISDIFGDFINNSAKGKYAYGGAIYNDSANTIGNITGNFINNSTTATSGTAYGGAIYNSGTIGNITGDFINSSANSTGSSSSYYAYGGAIYNYRTIGNITGDFINNSATSLSRDAYGGAIYNSDRGTIGNITGNFINNSVTGSSSYAYGGAIFNNRTIGNITGDFINNSINSTGSSNAQGGAIYNDWGTIGNIKGNFINNSVNSTASLASGGAIYNSDRGTIGNITGDFINNSAKGSSNVQGGAIYNYGSSATIGAKDKNGNIVGGIINSNFIGNYARSEQDVAQGGAIWTNQDLALISKDNNTSYITGNYVEDIDGKRPEAIFVDGASSSSNYVGNYKVEGETYKSIYQVLMPTTSTLSIKTENDGKFVIDDTIVGNDMEYTDALYYESWNSATQSYDKTYVEYDEANDQYIKIVNPEVTATARNKVLLTGDGTGAIYLNNNIEKLDITLDNANLYLSTRDDVLNGNNVTFNSGFLSMINNQVGVSALKNLTLNGNTNIVVDVDLANQTMDRFTAESYGNHGNNKLSVIGMNIVKDAPSSSAPLAIYFAEPGLKNNVSNGDINLPSEKWQTKAYTPLYQYTVTYDNEYATEENGLQDGGYFVFTQGGSLSGNPSDNFNPAVLATSVNTQAASQATVNETFKYVFEHADAFTQMPSFERQAIINSDRYALSTDFNHNLGSLCPEHNNKAGWFRPYVTFENMSLRNGPKVDAITYGSLVGFDSDFQHFKHGWTGVTTGYVGYNGNQLSYGGVDTSMNGGILGVTQTLYKGNFWSALTLSAGASVGESNTMYGKEDFTSLLAGVGSKTGYNFEFKEGKYIIQPIMFLSYTFVNTFDYTNAAGVKINASPAHSILLNPSIRFITNTKNGWQPYASVGMVWNVMNENKVIANNVRLPEMSMKPYVEYGLGIQKNWKDNFTAFGQAMLRNGGRNGIAFTAGMRWAIGHKHPEKVNKPQPKVIKQAKI